MPFSSSAVFTIGDSGGGNDRPDPPGSLVVFLRPFLRRFLRFHPPLDLRMRHTHDLAEQVLEILVFLRFHIQHS